jgi:hypothetical protein
MTGKAARLEFYEALGAPQETLDKISDFERRLTV